VVVLAAAALGAPATAAPAAGSILQEGGPTAVSEEFVVALNDSVIARTGVDMSARYLAERYGGVVGHMYRYALQGFSVQLSNEAARRLAADPAVRYVQQNHRVHISGTQDPTPSWGLARIAQRKLPLKTSYAYPTVASPVRAYVIDTGIRFTHREFAGRALSGRDTVDNDNDATDCNGHGTHVAGTLGGVTYGVAKGVTLIGVRVLDCSGSGSYAGVIAGIDWVTGDHDPGELAVANMSLGTMFDKATNDAVTASISDGVTYAVAAGNGSGWNACYVSPGSTQDAITVGATQHDDVRAPYSNVGPCLDVFAPGTGITSAWSTGDSAALTASGTSMASPHVAGAAALILAANPSFTPQQVRNRLISEATAGVVKEPGMDTPNRMLHINAGVARPAGFMLVPSPSVGVAEPDGVVVTTVSTSSVGGAQTVRLYATDLPVGVTASFNPSSVAAGGSSTLTLNTSASTPPGTYPVTVVGMSASAVQLADYTLIVNGAPFCSGTNQTDVAIPSLATAESAITIAGCASGVASASTVEVRIVHTHQGDLVVNLLAPDGTAYLLHEAAGGEANHIERAYTVNVAGERLNGVWTLRVEDTLPSDTGYINGWTLNLGTATTTACSAANGTDVAIGDMATAVSNIKISGCLGRASVSSRVEVRILHSYRSDLVVSLLAPDGAVYTLHNRTGVAAANIFRISTVDLSTSTSNGVWKLLVEDAASRDTGRIDAWSLVL
jgi:subtilisin family serine protease/subtilisin-like proprotein convertase family protein